MNEMEPGRSGPGRFLGLIIIYTLEYIRPIRPIREIPGSELVNDSDTGISLLNHSGISAHVRRGAVITKKSRHYNILMP